MQGTQDISVHVGTLHLTAKAVLEDFKDDIHPGDVFLVNDPYRGGTHFCDTRVILPVFYEDKLIAFMQTNGHWADVGGSNPGSFDVKSETILGKGSVFHLYEFIEKANIYRMSLMYSIIEYACTEERLGDLRVTS